MGLSSTDTILNATVNKMAKSATLMSFISIIIAVIAIVLSAWSIHSSNQTSKTNQSLYKQQLQKMNDIAISLDNFTGALNKSIKSEDEQLIKMNKKLNEIKSLLSNAKSNG